MKHPKDVEHYFEFSWFQIMNEHYLKLYYNHKISFERTSRIRTIKETINEIGARRFCAEIDFVLNNCGEYNSTYISKIKETHVEYFI